MQFVEMGNRDGKTLMLLPGTGCTYELNFMHVLDALKEKYHLICVNYDGFETEASLKTAFTDMITITEKIEDYIRNHFDGRIDACYGSSLGGSFVGQMFERNRIHIDHGFLGGSDLDESGKLVAKIMTMTFGRLIENICRNEKKLQKFKQFYAKKSKDQDESMLTFLDLFSESIKNTKPGTLCKEFYSDYITKLGNDIQVDGAIMHIIYATKMGKKYETRYRKHFHNPDIRKFDMSHESWLFCRVQSGEVLQCIDECINMPIFNSAFPSTLLP